MSQTVLVAEDDSKTVDLVRLNLRRDRCRVLTARNGRQAIDRARRRVSVAGRPAPLTSKQFALLAESARAPGRVGFMLPLAPTVNRVP